MTNLIFIEGVSGAGKSTAAKALAKKLCEMGFNAVYYTEGDIGNPIDFYCVAYLSADEYKRLLNRYAENVDLIGEHTIIADNMRLVRYYDGKTPLFPEPLLSELKDREFCYYPTKLLPFAEYCRVMESVWRNFAQSADDLPDYIIFDGSLLHHPINDMLRNYNAPLHEISVHIEKLLDAVQTLNPMAFYYNPKSVRDSLINARTSRHERAATEDDIAFWENRNRVDLAVLANLRIMPHMLNIPLGGWGVAFDEMLNMIITQSHYDALIDENNDPVHDPAELRAYMDKWDGQAFIDALVLAPDMSVLEIGVGTGRLAMKICGKCGSFTGVDLSPKTTERARENLAALNNVTLICGDFLTHSFADKYDIIYSSLTFMHIRDKRTAIEKTASLLNPGGRFVLSLDKNQQTELDVGTRKVPVYSDNPDEIRASLLAAGLAIENEFETEFAVVFAARKE
jgi:SAM-dependent methyltransferase